MPCKLFFICIYTPVLKNVAALKIYIYLQCIYLLFSCQKESLFDEKRW